MERGDERKTKKIRRRVLVPCLLQEDDMRWGKKRMKGEKKMDKDIILFQGF